MTDRFVTVGDDLALPPDVKVLDAHLPAASNAAAVGAKLDDAQLGAASGVAPLDSGSKLPEAHIPSRLSDASLNATYASKWKPNTAYAAGEKTTSPTGLPITAKVSFTSGASYDAANWDYAVVLNILDFGVVRGTAASQTAAIKAALDANPGASFYFPPGDYRLDSGLVIGKSNSLILSEGTRIYAGAPMTTLITYAKDTSGYAEDKSITGYGWLLDGALNAQRIMSLSKVIRFSLIGGNFKDGINRGLVTEAGLGAELFAEDLRFYNSGTTNVTDNIAIESNMGDSHYRNIIVRDWTVAFKDTSANRWDRCHPWISQDVTGNTQMTSRYPTSIGFDITGASDLVSCVTDTYRYAYKMRTNGTGYTAPPRLLNSRAMWANDPILQTSLATANPAYVLDNTDSVGVISDRLTMTGHTAAPANFLLGPATNLTTRNTYSYGYVKGHTGTVGDPLDYRGGVLNGTFTFTPTLYGSSSAGTHTYTAQTGRMVVNGPEVTYYIRVTATLDATTGFAGVMRVGGIPLPVGATQVRDGSGAVGLCKNVMISNAVILGSPTPYVTLLHQLPTTNPTSGTNNYAGTGSSMVEVGIPDLAGNQNLRGKAVDIILRVTTTWI